MDKKATFKDGVSSIDNMKDNTANNIDKIRNNKSKKERDNTILKISTYCYRKQKCTI